MTLKAYFDVFIQLFICKLFIAYKLFKHFPSFRPMKRNLCRPTPLLNAAVYALCELKNI